MSVWSPEFQALKRDWINLPEKCVAEANRLAEDAARGCAQAARTEYSQHWVTGGLTKRTYATQFRKGKLTPGWQARAAAPHAHLFEKGTKNRYYVTKPGKTKGSGGKIHALKAGPAKPGFRTMARVAPGFRRRMHAAIYDMLRRQKLEVIVRG